MAVLKIRDENGNVTGVLSIKGDKGDKGDTAYPGIDVLSYGAVGDGEADDTAAFKTALAENRTVFVPAGTYKLTEGIEIGENCSLELSQDTVLLFTQLDGNCITLNMSSTLKGNHATVKVPYEFSGNVLYASSSDTADPSAMPPFTKWDPMWKSGRYVTDLNICKADTRGFHYSVDGACSGTAVYISADGDAALTHMWGIHYSGLRIAGAFSYGIRAVNVNDGWCHEMRVDAFIDACEVGVSLEDCSYAYVSAIVQPRRAYTTDGSYTAYAKHGIELIRSKNVDLSASRVWDWDAEKTLWESGGRYQHLSMIGECRGLILSSIQYYEQSEDIRSLIYTDTESNLEQMTILQEPFTRYFKPKDGEPYFAVGNTEKKLITDEELSAHFDTDFVKSFTDVLSGAVDLNGDVLDGVGYKLGGFWNVDGVSITDSSYYGYTGFIPCKQGDVICADGLSYEFTQDDNARVVFYDGDFNKILHINHGNIIGGSQYYASYLATDNGFELTVNSVAALADVAYATFSFRKEGIGAAPMMAVNEEIEYTVEGFLADGIKVRGSNVIGLSGGGTSQLDAVAEVGQTIVAKTVDEYGVPTAWEGADYQPRTHYTKLTELLAETVFPELIDGATGISSALSFEKGKKYRVVYNGAEYVCDPIFDGDVDAGYIGNVALALGTGDTGEPFIIMDQQDDGNGGTDLVVCVLDGAESVTLSIDEAEYILIPQQYLANAMPYYIDVKVSDADGTTVYTCSDTAAGVRAEMRKGRELKLRVTDTANSVAGMSLVYSNFLTIDNENGLLLGFASFMYYTTSSEEVLRMFLTSQEDGSFAVDTVISDA